MLTGFRIGEQMSANVSAGLHYTQVCYEFQANSASSKVLRVLTIPTIDQKVCEKIYAQHRVVTPDMLCAGYTTGGKDTCQVRFMRDRCFLFVSSSCQWLFVIFWLDIFFFVFSVVTWNVTLSTFFHHMQHTRDHFIHWAHKILYYLIAHVILKYFITWKI